SRGPPACACVRGPPPPHDRFPAAAPPAHPPRCRLRAAAPVGLACPVAPAQHPGHPAARRRLPGRMPLRVRLIAAVVALVAAALLATSIGGISVLRGYLLRQAGNQLPGLAQTSSQDGTQYLITNPL